MPPFRSSSACSERLPQKAEDILPHSYTDLCYHTARSSVPSPTHPRGCIAASLALLFPWCCALFCFGSGCWNNSSAGLSPRTTVALPPWRKPDSLRIRSSLEMRGLRYTPRDFNWVVDFTHPSCSSAAPSGTTDIHIFCLT